MTFVEQVQALLEQTEAIGTDVVNASAEEVADALADSPLIMWPWTCPEYGGPNATLFQRARYALYCQGWEEQLRNALGTLSQALNASGEFVLAEDANRLSGLAEVADSLSGAVSTMTDEAGEVVDPENLFIPEPVDRGIETVVNVLVLVLAINIIGALR